MSELAQRLLEEALMLPEDERTKLAVQLLSPPSDEVEEAWRAELQSRVNQLEAGTAQTFTWEDVRAEALNRMRK